MKKMAKYGALAGAAAAAVGAVCSYEARVLHLHSAGDESFQISMTEVLGCKEGCCDPSSQTELTKDGPSSSSKPSSWYDGPNSYETLLFAPRY